MISHNRNQLILLATTYAPDCRYTIDKRLDGYYTMQFMESGGVRLEYDDRKYVLEGQWFWPAYPGPHLFFETAPGYESWFHRHVGFRGPLIDQWIDAGIWPWDPQPAPSIRDYRRFFDELIDLARRTDDWGWRRAVNMIEQLLIELAEARSGPETDHSWAREVIDVLVETSDFVPDYDALADRFDMGLSTLRRRFRESTGVSIHRWVMQSRIAEARRLLADTDMPIARIAERLRYENVYFFSRQFRQACGLSPSAYRCAPHRGNPVGPADAPAVPVDR